MGSSLLQYELLQNLTRLSAISNTYGGEYTFAGAPNETTNGSMFATDLCFAISSASDEPDAAWQFVRTCLSGEHQRLNIDYLPAVAAVLEESINNAVENGIEWYGYEYELDSADADKLRELLTDTATVENAYPDITVSCPRTPLSFSLDRSAPGRLPSTRRTESAPGFLKGSKSALSIHWEVVTV